MRHRHLIFSCKCSFLFGQNHATIITLKVKNQALLSLLKLEVLMLDFFFFFVVLGLSLGVSDPLSLNFNDDNEAVLPILPLGLTGVCKISSSE